MQNYAKYSDQIVDWLTEDGYTHCFFVAGGNIMHLLDSVREKMTCIPVVHEVAAGIAAEYFNESSDASKAFALVTAGPGITNIVTAIAGAWQESRSLLVIGGQVKSSDLATGKLRQRGIQEIDGVSIVDSITKVAMRLTAPVPRAKFDSLLNEVDQPRKGPVFIEVCLDVQASPPLKNETKKSFSKDLAKVTLADLEHTVSLVSSSERPVFLIGGGVDNDCARKVLDRLDELEIPIMTTYNGADRIPSSQKNYFGRPNTWGQRYSNVLLAQADVVVVAGSRLGLQQTGFNWKGFAPNASVVQVDIDPLELDKGHPVITLPIHADANDFMEKLVSKLNNVSYKGPCEWINFATTVRNALPLIEDNTCSPEFVSPYIFWNQIGPLAPSNSIFVPSSSGGTFTVAYQALEVQRGQRLISNKSLASMGYGLSGAIGVAAARPKDVVVLAEGDGGFAQNLQELGTVAINNMNIKMFIFDNDGYASIRMTQRNYFNGAWIGCDSTTGVGLPIWKDLAQSYSIPYLEMDGNTGFSDEILYEVSQNIGPVMVKVSMDPNQTYNPKVSSRVSKLGTMESNPLHLMSPDLNSITDNNLLRYL
jgi:acetolactate synthase-1/2/3 large subunit